MRRFLIAALIAALVVAAGQTANAQGSYFTVQLHPGDTIENIFERTIYRGTARRTSGYALYKISNVQGDRYAYDMSWAYYGRVNKPNDPAIAELAPDGVYYTQEGQRQLSTDSSGAFFNVWLWGTPPASLAVGTTWTHRIPSAWELGPAGTQTARVISIDPADDRIVLERTGSGIGAPLGAKLPKIDGVQPTWGTTTWKGITIVRRGLIESDELAVHHEIIVPKSASAPQHTETEIEQIELGQVPYNGTLP
jgi:hypothetical protein